MHINILVKGGNAKDKIEKIIKSWSVSFDNPKKVYNSKWDDYSFWDPISWVVDGWKFTDNDKKIDWYISDFCNWDDNSEVTVFDCHE